MAYKSSKGDREFGDLKNEDDTDTQIDWGSDSITFKTDDTARLLISNLHLSSSNHISGAAFYTTNEISGNVFYGDGSNLTGISAGGGGISFNGSTANGLVTYGNASTADVESKLAFDGSVLHLTGALHISGSLPDFADAHMLVIQKAANDSTKEIVFTEDGVDQGGIYFNNNDHLFLRNENNGKDIIIRVDNASGGGRNLIRAVGSSEGLIVGFENSKTTAEALLDVDGDTAITGSLGVSQSVSGAAGFFAGAGLETTGDISGSGALYVNQAAALNSGANVLGLISGSGQATLGDNLLISGDQLVGGALSVSGAVTLGGVNSGSAAGPGSYIGVDLNGMLVLDTPEGSGGGGGISWDGSTANGVATYKDDDEATVEANLTFDGSTLGITGNLTATTTVSGAGGFSAGGGVQTTGNISGSGTLAINGGSAFNSDITILGNVSGSGTIRAGNGFQTTGNISGSGELNINDDATFNDDVVVIGSTGLGVGNPLTRLDVRWNPVSLADNTGGGDVVMFGAGTLTTGKLYYLHTDGNWTEADADAAASGADQLLGIALGSSPTANGVLIRGFFDASTYLSNFSSGKAIYISTTSGQMDTTSPSGTGDIVRIVGYCTNTANVIYFNPSSEWIELS